MSCRPSNCRTDECACPDFKIKQHSTEPPFRVAIEDCNGMFDLSDEGLTVVFSVWTATKLKLAISATDTTLKFADDVGFEQILVGDVIEIPHVRAPEMLVVTGFDEDEKTVEVTRGYNGTTARAWTKGQVVNLFRLIDHPGAIDIVEAEVESELDGSISTEVVDSYLVLDWTTNSLTELPGCYNVEFTLTQTDLETSEVEWTRRFPEEGNFKIKIISTPNPTIS